MKLRVLTSLCISAMAAVVTVVLLAPVGVAAQDEKKAAAKPAATRPAAAPKKLWMVSRTPDGVPDLQGYWTNNSYTPLERPNGVTKEFYTLEELRAVEKKNAEREEEQTVPGTVADVHYDFTQFGLDRSQTRLTDNLRTSVITNGGPEESRRSGGRTEKAGGSVRSGPEHPDRIAVRLDERRPAHDAARL
jgi:hypothetical protein